MNSCHFTFTFAACLILMAGCEKKTEDFPGQEPPEEVTTYAVKIGDGNANLPGPGILTLEFSDFLDMGDLNRAVDNNIGTKLMTPHDRFYISWKGDKAFAAGYYYFGSGDEGSENDPKSWKISASNDGISWTLLDARSDEAFPERQEIVKYRLENAEEYIYYRLEVDANNGSDVTHIAEWGIGADSAGDMPSSINVGEGNTNVPAPGVLSVSYPDYPEGHGIDKLIDGMKTTSYITFHDSFDVIWAGKNAGKVTILTLVSSPESAEYDPKSWTVYGSADGQEWTAIDSQDDVIFTERRERKWFPFENTAEYGYYKVSFEANNGGDYTEIAEIQLLEVDMDISLILAKAKAHTREGALTEMGHFFKHRADSPTTAEELAWLKDPSCEPDGSFSGVENQYPPLIDFKVDLYPYGKPVMADANQRGIGDCCAIAVFAEMAYCYPDFIQSIIKDNGDDTYTVKMFDPNRERIEVGVSNKFWAGDPGYLSAAAGKGATQATWATVMEKALMKYQEVFSRNPNIGGIGTPVVSAPFTGCGYGFAYNYNSAVMSPEEWHLLVKVLLMKGYILVGGFWVGGYPLIDGESITGHAFSFVHSADPTALFGMRNPWGNGSKDGVYTIPFDDTVLKSQVDVWIFEPGTEVLKYNNGVYEPYSYPF